MLKKRRISRFRFVVLLWNIKKQPARLVQTVSKLDEIQVAYSHFYFDQNALRLVKQKARKGGTGECRSIRTVHKAFFSKTIRINYLEIMIKKGNFVVE